MHSQETAAPAKDVAPAEADFSQVGTRDLENQAVKLTNAQSYVEAIPVLQELVRRFSDSDQEQSARKLEGMLYFLGLGYVLSENWSEAVTTYEEFLKRYPQSPRSAAAREFYAAALASSGQNKEAAQQYQLLLQQPNLPGSERIKILEKLVAVLLAGKQWAEAIPVLTRLLETSRDERQREILATALARSYIETDQANKVLEILPNLLSRAPRARLSAEFNIALLAGGDRLRAAGQPLLALLFYQLILPTERLREWNARLIEENEELVESLRGTGRMEAFLEARRVQELLLREKAVLEAAPDFSEDLRMRIAQTYFSNNRQYEALWTFWNIFLDYPEGKFARDACYATFALASQLQQDDKAKEAGLHYMSAYPDGDHWNEVSVGLAQLFTRTREFDLASEFINTVVQNRPDHPELPALLYLLGFAEFQEEQFALAQDSFKRVMEDFPQSQFAPAALYWTGMTYIFQGEFAKAQETFRRYLAEYPEGEFAEDASFRNALTVYAQEDFAGTAKILREFVERYPRGPITGEAHNLLADCYGALGRLDEAEKHYRLGIETASRQPQIDHAAFQLAKIFEMEQRFAETVTLFTNYLADYGTQGNYTQAIYQKGLALRKLGREEEAMETYWKAVEEYGDEHEAMGLDLILADYLQAKGEEGMAKVQAAARSASSQPELRGYYLRLIAALDRAGTEVTVPAFTDDDIEVASPAVLAWMGERATDRELGRAALDRLTRDYGRTQWAVDGWMTLGNMLAEAKDYPAAEEAYLNARNLLPLQPIAAVATKKAADMRREQKRYTEAISLYEEILQVREWRGAIWPEALFSIGETLQLQGKHKEAYPFYQRIYVLYRSFPDWTARSYLRCAEISMELGLKGDALRTLAEMLHQEDLQDLPETAQARALFEKIQ